MVCAVDVMIALIHFFQYEIMNINVNNCILLYKYKKGF